MRKFLKNTKKFLATGLLACVSALASGAKATNIGISSTNSQTQSQSAQIVSNEESENTTKPKNGENEEISKRGRVTVALANFSTGGLIDGYVLQEKNTKSKFFNTTGMALYLAGFKRLGVGLITAGTIGNTVNSVGILMGGVKDEKGKSIEKWI